jgi:hypothetical protein
MLTPILIASLAISGTASPLPISVLGRHRSLVSPTVQVWTNRDDAYRRGDKVKVYFQTDVDAYVTIFRVDTDGRVRVLFPLDPWGDNYAVGGERYQVDPRNDGYTFRIDEYPGEGYLFAVATLDPFIYSSFVRGDHWDYRVIGTAGRITGDPYVAIGDLIDGIVPANYVDYSYDVLPYFVEQHYDYPRFLCYDCHAYAAYPYWDPYAHSCVRFRIVIYDDPYYYPARTYYRTRVVYQRPRVYVPRYVFKDRTPNDQYVVTVKERPIDATGRRRIDPGVTRRDLSGGVLLPTPVPARPSGSPPAATGRRLAPGTPAERPLTARETPTLERRDPARAPTVPSRGPTTGPTTPERRQPTPVKPPETKPVPVPKRTEKPVTPPKRHNEQPVTPPTRRNDPPAKVTPPTRRNDPPAKVTPPTRRNDPPAKVTPPTRRNDPPAKATPPTRRNDPPAKATPPTRTTPTRRRN